MLNQEKYKTPEERIGRVRERLSEQKTEVK